MIDLENVQRIVLQSDPRPLCAILMFKIGSVSGARAFIACWRNAVRGGDDTAVDSADRTFSLGFALSWSALARLAEGIQGLDVESGRRQFDWTFTDPTQQPDQPASREELGLVGDSDAQHWWDGLFATQDIELALIVHFVDAVAKAAVLPRLRASAAEHDLIELRITSFVDGAMSGYRPPGGVLHFGYVDGLSRLDVDWSDSRAGPPFVNFREIVVGYPSQDYPTAPQAAGPWQDFARDGAFLGITWIYQDVARFNRFLEASATAFDGNAAGQATRELIASRLMGRWRDGSPLSLYPDAQPRPASPRDDFDYADDPLGRKCPLAAHIRVVHPRNQPLSYPNQVRFPNGPPRLLRRGFSYGEALDSAEDDGQDRGLVGMFIFARPNEQFYTVLRWIHKTDFSDDFARAPNGLNGQDYLCGARSTRHARSKLRLDESTDSLAVALQDFIRFKGVALLFLPSLRALRMLSTGFEDPSAGQPK